MGLAGEIWGKNVEDAGGNQTKTRDRCSLFIQISHVRLQSLPKAVCSGCGGANGLITMDDCDPLKSYHT